MLDVRLYLAQRISAMIMAPLVLVHLGVMIYAVRGGLDAAEILSRTRGSIGWALFYGCFVVAVAVHGAIGVRVIVFESFNPDARVLSAVTWIVGLVLLGLGGQAVVAVVL